MRYVRQKMIQLVIVVIAVTFLTFIAINLLPGDPAIFKAGPGATDAQVAQVRHDLGLDKPIPVQYGIWLKKMATLDFGVSLGFNTPVSELVRNRLPVTLVVLLYAEIMSMIVAIPLGVFSAYRAGSAFDRGSNTVAFALLSVPNYIIGVVLLYFFAVRWGWFPAISNQVSLFDNPVEHFKGYFLPALTLAVAQVAIYTRLLRTDMIATLQMDFITMARAKGMPTRTILFRHAMRPSLFSLITASAVNIGALIGGAVIVEQIFALPGMGQLTVEAIGRRDFPVVQVCVTIFAVGFVFVNFVVDVAYAFIDPRIRHARALS